MQLRLNLILSLPTPCATGDCFLTVSVCRLDESDTVSRFSLKDNVTGSDTLCDVHARTSLPRGREGNGSQLCSRVRTPLTLYENAHIPTAEVDVIGNLTPVNSRVVPLEGTQEEQSAVDYFHSFWHFTVQSVTHKRHKHLDTQKTPT